MVLKGDKEKKVSKTSEEETGQTNAAQNLYDEQRVAEQDILREEYKTGRREKKREAAFKIRKRAGTTTAPQPLPVCPAMRPRHP